MAFPCPLDIRFHPFIDDSISRRLSSIVYSVLDTDIAFPSEELRSKLSSAGKAIADLSWIIENIDGSDGGPDWSQYCAPFVGKDVKQVPWFFLENYTYRFMLSCTGYYKTGIDPFSPHKEKAIDGAKSKLLERLNTNTLLVSKGDEIDTTAVKEHLVLALLGNRADLSLSAGKATQGSDEKMLDFLLVDEAAGAIELMRNASCIIIILDNCGAELFEDLLLVATLLKWLPKLKVVLHCKSHPVFVSDALVQDVHEHIKVLRSVDETIDLQGFMKYGRLEIESHDFYTTPLSFYEMPNDLKEMLSTSSLVITKGDANYRRLLGDGMWPHSACFSDAVNYWPTALLAIRTCKSPVIVGVAAEVQDRVKSKDAAWLLNGDYGVLQFKP